MNLTHYAGKTICVTGGAGSIGSEICRMLVRAGVKEIRLVSLTEAGLFNIERELKVLGGNIVPILGSVTDEALLDEVMPGVDIVIHAAAHKHVPLCEQNPLAAIQNNLGGTKTLVNAASRHGVAQFVMISSDKAVKPKSIMGMTKRACELFVQFAASRSATKFTIVRFGNVLDSAGSVLPLWREQLAKGEPITITDKRCTRFFMSIPEAAGLVLGAAALRRPDGLFVLDMGEPLNLYDLALSLTNSDNVREIGLRPGEKLHEELSTVGSFSLTDVPKVLRVDEPPGRLIRWMDFDDILTAAKVRAKVIAVNKLKELVS